MVRYKTEGGYWSSMGTSDGIVYVEQIPAFIYDRNGNRTGVIDSRGATIYEYDVLNRLVKVTEPDGKWIAYTYDLNSNRTSMTVHLDESTEHVTEYSYYDNNLLHEVTDQLDGVTHYTYDGGLVDTITYPNGTKAIHSYNSRNWLTTISNQKSDDTVIAEFTYSYDPTYWGKNGTRTRVIENILKPDSNRINAQVDYEYDDQYRLIHEHRIAYNGGDPGVAYEYNFDYDDAGNRTEWQVVGGATTTYTYDAANKMTSPGTFTYDDAGNTLTHTVSSITTTYTWDYLNRLTQWQKTNETTQDYVYNADGMRVSKTPSGGTATNYLLDGDEIVEEITGENVTSYVGRGLISKIAGTTRTIYHADGLGSTRALSDDDTPVAIIEAGIYDAYGNAAVIYGSSPSFGYAGQYRYYADSTGMDYLKMRYYNPAVGRLLSKDPIGYAGGSNLYAYVENCPTNAVDPNGLLKWWWSILPIFPGGTTVQLIIQYRCALAAFDAGQVWRDRNNHPMAHCVAACELANCPGSTAGFAEIIGGLMEEYQWFDNGFDNPYWDAAAVWNHIGDDLGSNGCGNCEDACHQKYNEGLLQEDPWNQGN